ncbi:MAG: spermidine synthase [Thermoanaerobaculales bacterium]
MKPQQTISSLTTPDGDELVLYERDGVFSIRVGGRELMTSRVHGSEEALASMVLARVRRKRPRVLVGGLGMGFTLRAVLDVQPPVSRIVVVELFRAVVDWNRTELAHLTRAPLDDLRVSLIEGDVAEVIRSSPKAFDAVLLDVDNGPTAFTVQGNERLYGVRGLASISRSLRPGGVLGLWSADPDPSFERRLRTSGFRVRVERVSARGVGKGPKHIIYMARPVHEKPIVG